MTLFNYWHYITLSIIILTVGGAVYATLKQPNKKLVIPVIISISLIALLLVALSIVVVDKYTKVVTLYNVKNKRLLSTEQIVYTGTVKNEGNHAIGEVTFVIKIVNKGHTIGNVKGGSYFTPSGFFDFVTGTNVLYKPPAITEEFVVAENLKPGEAKAFRVYFKFPPHFRSVSQYESVKGH